MATEAAGGVRDPIGFRDAGFADVAAYVDAEIASRIKANAETAARVAVAIGNARLSSQLPGVSCGMKDVLPLSDDTRSSSASESPATRLARLGARFDGRVGIYVRHLKTGEEIQVNADEVFPAASMVKIPIMLATFAAIERGDLAYHGTQVYRESLLSPGDDLLGSFADGQEILLSKLVLLMLSMSDNTASLWLQHLAGGGEAINTWLDEAGFSTTRINTRTEGRRTDFERFGWGQTSPREMAEILVAIRHGDAVSPAASQEMYRALTRTYWDDEAISELPPWIQAASKQGVLADSKSEVVLVNAPSGDYVFCVITDEQSDTWWVPDNAGYVLIRETSRMLWEHFEPENPWKPERTGVYQAP